MWDTKTKGIPFATSPCRLRVQVRHGWPATPWPVTPIPPSPRASLTHSARDLGRRNHCWLTVLMFMWRTTMAKSCWVWHMMPFYDSSMCFCLHPDVINIIVVMCTHSTISTLTSVACRSHCQWLKFIFFKILHWIHPISSPSLASSKRTYQKYMYIYII